MVNFFVCDDGHERSFFAWVVELFRQLHKQEMERKKWKLPYSNEFIYPVSWIPIFKSSYKLYWKWTAKIFPISYLILRADVNADSNKKTSIWTKTVTDTSKTNKPDPEDIFMFGTSWLYNDTLAFNREKTN